MGTDWASSESWHGSTKAQAAMDGMLALQPALSSSTKLDSLKTRWANKAKLTVQCGTGQLETYWYGDSILSPYAAYWYDAVLVVAHGLDRLVKAGGSVTDHRALYQFMRNSTFEGAS